MDYTIETTDEKNNRKKGLITSFALHIILLLLALAPFMTIPDPPPGQPGILVALGLPDAGMNDAPASSAPDEAASAEEETVEEVEEVEPVKEEPKKPVVKPKKTKAPVKPKKDVLSDKNSRELALKKKKEADRKKAEREAKIKEEAAAKAKRDAAAKAAKAKADAAAKAAKAKADAEAAAAAEAARKKAEADKWKNLGKVGSGSGSGGKPGNQGQQNGDPDGKALDGISTGSGDIGGGLLGRKKVSSPKITNNSQKTGIVVVRVCVDSKGKVVSAKYTQSGSTTTDQGLIKSAIAGARKYRFSKGDVDKQCGTIKINFRLR